MGNKMSKNIKISDIDSAKLLNGEMNSEGVNICNSFVEFEFDNDENYDRIIGILEVDSQNKAVLDSNNKPNFKVFINKDGKQYRSEDIVIPHYDDNYNDRLIDTVFPFSEIRKVIMRKYEEGESWQFEFKNNLSNIHGELDTYASDLRNSNNKFPDAYIEEVFKNVKTIDEGDDSSSEIYSGWYETSDLTGYEPSTYYSVVKIPLFYFRTYFDVSKHETSGKYYRCYEIISEDVYNKLSDKNKTCFSIPKAFYTQNSSHELHKVLYVTSQPISRNGVFNCFGSENNIFDPLKIFCFGAYSSIDHGYTYHAPEYLFNEYGMSAEIWYGVICYLMRLYTGSFDLCDIYPDSSTYDLINQQFNKCIDFLNQDETKVFTFEKVITSSNISDTESKILDNNNKLVFPRNCFYWCTDSYFVTSNSDFFNKYSNDYELQKITVTPIDSLSGRNRFRIDGLNLSDGTYFVSNFFIFTDYAEYVKEDKLSIGNKCFVLTVSNGNITINNTIIYGYNDKGVSGLKKMIYSENGSMYFETTEASENNVGAMFYLYKAYTTVTNGIYKSNVLEFLFERIGSDGSLIRRAVVNAFIDTEMTSNAGHWQVIPIMDDDGYTTMPTVGVILDKENAVNYLKTKFFSNYNATSLGTDIIRISTYEHPWNGFGFGIDQNDRMLSCVNKKNAYIGNKLTIMHFSDIFRPFKIMPYCNLNYCYFNNRPQIYEDAPMESTSQKFNRDTGDFDQIYYVTSNIVTIGDPLLEDTYFLFGCKIFDSENTIDFSNVLNGFKLVNEGTPSGYYYPKWSLMDSNGTIYTMNNKKEVYVGEQGGFYVYIYQAQTTPPRLIIESKNQTQDLQSFKTELVYSLQNESLFVGSRLNNRMQSGVFINNMSCNFSSGKKLKLKTYDFYHSTYVEFDTVNIATNNIVNKYFMFCDQEEIEANNGMTFTRTPVNDSQGKPFREYYNSDTSFIEIPITNSSNDGTFFNYEEGRNGTIGWVSSYETNPLTSEPDFIFSVGSMIGSAYENIRYSPKPSLYSINMIELPIKNNYFKWFFRFNTTKDKQEFIDERTYDYDNKYLYIHNQALMLTFLNDD